MRPTVIRRTAIAASAVCLALLATACGGSDSGGEDKEKTKVEKTEETAPAEPAAKAKTAAELEKLALADGDVEGHKVEKAGPDDTIAAKDISVDKAECEPLAQALSAAPVGEPGATVRRKATSEPKKDEEGPSLEELADMTEEEMEEALTAAFDMTMTLTALSSYDGEGAGKAVAALRTAAAKCSGGFTATVSGDKQKVTKLADESVKGGEEALAWTVTVEQDGEKMPLKLVAVRQGDVLATFSVINVAAAGSGKDFDLPTAVVDAQVAKLG
ncbi:MAG TPA: hypothetical protein VFY14_20450 [Streptomyces sp.]|nr:hypothetical protein [Streptomyces sp.]